MSYRLVAHMSTPVLGGYLLLWQVRTVSSVLVSKNRAGIRSDFQNQNQNQIWKKREPDWNWIWFSEWEPEFIFWRIATGTGFLVPFMCGTGTTVLIYCLEPEPDVLHESKKPPNTDIGYISGLVLSL
jgi:hypothetical protein